MTVNKVLWVECQVTRATVVMSKGRSEKERIKKKERAKEVKGIKRKKEMMENPNDCNVSEI